jgi:hypothetical protein
LTTIVDTSHIHTGIWEVASRSAPLPQRPDTAHALSLGGAITAFMEDLAIRKVSQATVKAYRADLVAVTALLGARDGEWPVTELVGPVLRSAFAVFAVDHAPASVSRARSTWKALFDVLVADGHLAGNPMAAVPRSRLAAGAPKPLLGWDKDTVERLVAFVMGDGRPGRVVWPELGSGRRRPAAGYRAALWGAAPVEPPLLPDRPGRRHGAGDWQGGQTSHDARSRTAARPSGGPTWPRVASGSASGVSWAPRRCWSPQGVPPLPWRPDGPAGGA